MLPGLLMAAIGVAIGAVVLTGTDLFGRPWYAHALIGGALLVILGVQVLGLGFCGEVYAADVLNKPGTLVERLRRRGLGLKHAYWLGSALMLCGLALGGAVIVKVGTAGIRHSGRGTACDHGHDRAHRRRADHLHLAVPVTARPRPARLDDRVAEGRALKWPRQLTIPLWARAIVSIALDCARPLPTAPGRRRAQALGRRVALVRARDRLLARGPGDRRVPLAAVPRGSRHRAIALARGARVRDRRVRQQLPAHRLRRRRAARLACRFARHAGRCCCDRHRRPSDDARDGDRVRVARVRARPGFRPIGARADVGGRHGAGRGRWSRSGRRPSIGRAPRLPAAVPCTVGSRLGRRRHAPVSADLCVWQTALLGLAYEALAVFALWLVARSISLDLSFALLAVSSPPCSSSRRFRSRSAGSASGKGATSCSSTKPG